MTIAGLLARSPKRHTLQQRAVVANAGGFPDHDAGAMIEHNADANVGGRVDVDGKNTRALALKVEGEVAPSPLEQLVGKSMRDEGVETLEVEQRLDVALAGRIAIEHGGKIGAKGAAELGLLAQDLGEGLHDEAGVDVGMIEPLRQAVADGVFETGLAEDGGKDEATEGRLVGGDLLGLVAHRRPDGIDGGNVGPPGTQRFGSHGVLLRPA